MRNQWVNEHISGINAEAPFSFVYDGQASEKLLVKWPKTVESKKLDAARTQQTLTWTDPKTGLEVRCVVVDYADYPVVEWTVYFTNKGGTESPIIEHINALDAVVAPDPVTQVVLHRLNGAPSAIDDWMPFDQPIAEGQRIAFAATAGRSSNVSP